METIAELRLTILDGVEKRNIIKGFTIDEFIEISDDKDKLQWIVKNMILKLENHITKNELI